jgi:branched-subunit amino acid transport protein
MHLLGTSMAKEYPTWQRLPGYHYETTQNITHTVITALLLPNILTDTRGAVQLAFTTNASISWSAKIILYYSHTMK